MAENIIEIKNLEVEYKTAKINGTKIIKAVKGVSFEVKRGETYAIAGESGCGKSTLAKAIMKLIPIKSGEILFEGKNINEYSKAELKEYRKNIQMVFQNPYSSLNPKMTIRAILSEPLKINTDYKKEEIDLKVENIIKMVGLDKNHLDLYPHEFSGGQRQRIAIARALILQPKVVIADEPVSALDASIQAQILNLLNDLKKELNLTLIFISHDLSVIKFLSDRVNVMYMGEIMEEGKKSEIFDNPIHKYTKTLLKAVPQYGPKNNDSEIPEDISLPEGCDVFFGCKHSDDDCVLKCPEFTQITPTHKVRCSV